MRSTIALVAISLALVGCKDPGAQVTAAEVEASAPEANAPAGNTDSASALAINPSNSKVEFVGAKVTASHPGGFTDFSGKVELGDPIEQSRVQLTIQTASLYADK